MSFSNHHLCALELIERYDDWNWVASHPGICQKFGGQVVAVWGDAVVGSGSTSFAALVSAQAKDPFRQFRLLPCVLVPTSPLPPSRPP